MKGESFWLDLNEAEHWFLEHWEDNSERIISNTSCKDLLYVREMQLRNAANIYEQMLTYDQVEGEYRDRITAIRDYTLQGIDSIDTGNVMTIKWCIHQQVMDSQTLLTKEISKFLYMMME